MAKIAKIGFIGCGGIATRFHFKHFEQLQDKARIVAVCDIIEEKAKAAAERFQGARAYTDYHLMLEKEKLDAVYICVPPSCHDGMELEAIKKGIHIFCQKPMSLDLKYCKKVWNAMKKNNIISSVGLHCRYADSLDFVSKFIGKKLRDNEVGMFSAYRVTGFPIVWWWRQRELSGGQVVEQCIHNYDLLRCMLGEVSLVQAAARHGLITEVPKYNAEDASSVILTFKNGVIGTFNSGCFYNDNEGDINIYFRNGKLKYSIYGQYSITEPNRQITGTASNDFGLESDETFVDAVRGVIDSSEILTPYDDAMKSLALTLAVNASFENGGMPVKPEL